MIAGDPLAELPCHDIFDRENLRGAIAHQLAALSRRIPHGTLLPFGRIVPVGRMSSHPGRPATPPAAGVRNEVRRAALGLNGLICPAASQDVPGGDLSAQAFSLICTRGRGAWLIQNGLER